MKYYDNQKAVINPSDFVKKIDGMPEIGIACYSHVLFDKIIEKYQGEVIGELDYTDTVKKIYRIEYKENKYAIFMMSVGAPAAATCIEDIHAMGCNKFIVFGNCGVLDKNIEDLAIIIPTNAIRDEGLSSHYLEYNKTIKLNEKYGSLLKDILNQKNYSFIEGTTWTTDAFYRETKEKIEYFKKRGAICVEMEGTAIAAICKRLSLDYFTFYYAGDSLDSDEWDKRSLSGLVNFEKKQKVKTLALELAHKISNN